MSGQFIYNPTPPPAEAGHLGTYLLSELQRVSDAILESAKPPLFYAEPKNAQEGLLVRADGTGWNPGSGAGLYIYRSSAWVFIV
jgi:hypothetical protein